MAQIFFLLLQLLLCMIYIFVMGSLLYSNYKGAPWVRTPGSNLDELVGSISIPKGSQIVELGCGTGGVLRALCHDKTVRGVGVDINPLLLWIARLIAKIHHQNNVTFVRKNIYDYSLAQVDFVYLFLMPKMLEKLEPKLRRECRNGTTIISLGFKIPGFEDGLVKKIDSKPYHAYIYKT